MVSGYQPGSVTSIFRTSNRGYSRIAAIAAEEFNYANTEMDTSQELTPALLAEFNVLIITGARTSRSLSPDESQTLVDFVTAGGSLFISSEGGNPGDIYASSAAEPFGVTNMPND